MYHFALSFLYVYASRNKKDKEIQNDSVNKLAKKRAEIVKKLAERQGGQHYKSDHFIGREVMSRKWGSKVIRWKRVDVERTMQKEVMLLGEK